MDGEVWGELPQELLIQILARLSPILFLRLRSVCKQWNNLPLYAPFSLLHTHTHPSPPPGFIIRTQIAPSSDSLYYIHPSSSSSWLKLPLHLIIPSPVSFQASSSSLLCCSQSISRAPSCRSLLHVCNPLSRAWKRLPPSTHRSPFLVGLAHDPRTGEFKVVVAGRLQEVESRRCYGGLMDLSAEVYDSRCNQWRMVDPALGASMAYAEPLHYDGRIFWLSRTCRPDVLVFDVEQEAWSRVEASWPESCQPYNLWEWHGHLFMVGEKSEVLTVWKLQDEHSAWIEFTTISPRMANVADFCGEKDVAGHSNFVCIMLVWARKGVLYDLLTKQLIWLPYCPLRAFNWGNVMAYKAGFGILA